MNCFMGYNPLATKQVKVTVWVCEQDGATPVAPSNPSAGDCFIVYATDEAVLSNTPTSAKTYADGEWKDAEGGGGGGGDLSAATMSITMGKSTQYASANSIPVVLFDSAVGVLQEVSQSDYEVVLVKGSVETDFGTAEPITTYSGDIVVGQYELVDDTYYTPVTITGDCALTLVGWKNE